MVWKLCIRQWYWSIFNTKALKEQHENSKKFLKGGITGSADMSYDYRLSTTLGITKRNIIRSFRAWNEIEIGELIPNYLVYQYVSNDAKSFIATKFDDIVSTKVTILNFGSCTYVYSNLFIQ